MTATQDRYRRAEQAVRRYAGNEVVVLPVRGGEFVSLSSSAAALWQALDEPRTFEEVLDLLAQAYGTSPEAIADGVRSGLDHLERVDAVLRTAPAA